MKFLLTAIASCFYLINFGQPTLPTFVSDSLNSYIDEGLSKWNIPGLAICIIKDGKPVVMKGFGVRNIETKEPVDENTLFMIASNSKLFTGTALAQLEYDKKISLDDKINKYFPDFRLFDSNASEMVTIRDMLCHRIGTTTFQGDFVFWNSNLTRKQIMNKMRLLKPSFPFRQQYGYCNSCFLTAGEIIPSVTGKPWEVYIYDSILFPAGMYNTHTLTQGFSQRNNIAFPYTNAYSGKLTRMPFDNIDNIGAAGSLVSSIKDLSRWLMLQLDSGKLDGKRVLPWEILQKTRDINIITRSRKSSVYPMHFQGYGLGLFSGDYFGKQIFWHTGGADGYVTNTCFVPEEKLAITILTNNDNQSFFEALRYQILDAYLGVPYVNRSNFLLQNHLKELEESSKTNAQLTSRVKGANPSLPLEKYVGVYENEIYGEITVSREDNSLKINFKNGNNLTARLDYMDSGEWLMKYSIAGYGIFPVKFDINNTKVLSILIKVNDFIDYDPYLFIKK